jgi:hypothetical protein
VDRNLSSKTPLFFSRTKEGNLYPITWDFPLYSKKCHQSLDSWTFLSKPGTPTFVGREGRALERKEARASKDFNDK